MTSAQLRTKTRTSISRKICCVKSGFQILYAVEQFSSLFSKDKLKQWEYTYTKPMIHLPRAFRGRTVVRFPANSSHMYCVELALDRLLCTHLVSKDFLRRGFSPFIKPTALPRRWAPIRAKQLSVAALWLLSDMAVRLRVCVPLAVSLHYFQCNRITFNLFFLNYCSSWHF